MNDTTELNIPELFANPDYVVISEYRSKQLAVPYWYGVEFMKADARFYLEMGIDELIQNYPDILTLINIVIRHPKHNELHYGRICYHCIAYHD